ncbi:MAG: precorrin-2 dehydrogenase/sirohydrochlorin ferrochelatase family protein [Alphaproteobacteria bacterium]
MPTIPIFLKTDKPCLVVGGGEIARQKIEWILKIGARAIIMAPQICPELSQMITNNPTQLTLKKTEYTKHNLSIYALVIAATDDCTVNQEIAADTRAAHLPINVVDDPPLCSFYVPATVARGDLHIAIGTNGNSPSLARSIRAQLEDQYPERYAIILSCLSTVREMLKEKNCNYQTKKKILGTLTAKHVIDDFKGYDRQKIENILMEKANKLLKENQ